MRNFTTDKIKGLSRIDLARRVNQYYSRSIQERVIVNTDTGIRIYFNSVGRIKSAKRYSSKEKAIVIINLLVLLAEAKRVSTKTIRENSAIYKNIPGALMVFNFLIKCKIDGRVKKFTCGVILMKNGSFHYSLYHNEIRAKK